MRKGLPLLVVLCALVMVPAAQARPHRMTFDFAQMVAADYWAKRGVIVPCHPRERLWTWREAKAHDLSYLDADMFADVSHCTVDVMPWADLHRSDPDLDQDYCSEIAHEMGHIAGLEHPDHVGLTPDQRAFVTGTVMDPWGDFPYGCTHPRKFLRHGLHVARAGR